MSTDLKISQLTPATTVNTNDFTVMVDGNTSANKRATVAQILAIAGAGTVTSINVSGANGINSSGGPITSSGTIALSLGAITPTSIVASGTISGSNLSNTNTGDQAITVVGDVTAPASTGTLTTTLANSVVTNDKLANMVGPTVKGRTSGTGIPQDLSTAQVTAMLPEMVADSGTGGTKGLVPPPTAGSAAAKKFLRADATWVATDLNDILPSQGGNAGKVLQTSGTTTSWQAVGVGSVTNVSVTTANGVSGTVATSTTTPAISLSLGAITPTSVNSVVVSGTSTPTLAVTGTSSISGNNTGDQTISLTGGVTGSGTGSFATTVVTNANLTGVITSVGNATSIASQTGTGSKFVVDTSPTLITPNLGTPSALVGTNITGTASGLTAGNVTTNANLTGGVTSVGNAATVVTNANLTGDVTSVGNATTLTNAPVIAKVLTGYTSGAGTVAATDSILQAIQKLNGNDATNANLTGVITSVGNATSIASQTGTGTKFVVDTSPVLITPNLGTPSAAVLTSATGLPLTTGVTGTLPVANGGTGITSFGSGIATFLGTPTSANLAAAVTDETGSGSLVFATLPTFGGTGVKLSGSTSGTTTLVSGAAAGTSVLTLPVATDTLVGRATTDTLTNKTLTSPTLTTPALGTPASGTVTNLTGTASININGTVGATTPSTVAATLLNVAASTRPTITVETTGVTAKGRVFHADGNAGGRLDLSSNLSFDGTNWQRDDTGQPSSMINLTSGNFQWRRASAASNPASITTILQGTDTGLAVTGTLSATGSIFTGTTAEITPTSGTQDGMSLNSAGLLTISRNNAGAMQVRRRTSDGNLQVFFRDTTSVGSIQVTTTGTTFTTTSDYRLKNITGLLTDSGTFIDALKPKTGTWKSNGSKFVGFLAHEFAEVSSSSVVGEKDAVDADGNSSFQSMQAGTPEVMANIVAELQSLRKRLAALESK